MTQTKGGTYKGTSIRNFSTLSIPNTNPDGVQQTQGAFQGLSMDTFLNDRGALVTTDISHARLQQRLGHRQNAFAMESVALA